jgi:hypothetical protein
MLEVLCGHWVSALQLLLSDTLWHHASAVVRAAAVTVPAALPARAWCCPLLPAALRQQLLAAAAGTATGDAVTAVRAAAAKTLGSLAVLPGVLSFEQQQQQGEQQQQQLCEALVQCVGDEAVSVRLNAALSLSTVCDQQGQQQGQQQGREQGSSVDALPLQLLCDAALAAASDTEKVRCHGVRAIGALLVAWQPSARRDDCAVHVAGGGAAKARWSSSSWLGAALSSLQSCLAARSMKVVWNAACAAGAALQNEALLQQPEVGRRVLRAVLVAPADCVCDCTAPACAV